MGLQEAQFAEQQKLDARQHAPIAAASARAYRFANGGTPVAAARELAREFEALLERISALESRVAELEKANIAPGLRGVKVERRNG